VKIIILGAGQVGRTAAVYSLVKRRNDITVIDVNEEILRDLQDRSHTHRERQCSSPRILEAAGLPPSTSWLITTATKKKVNMLACQIAWTL